MELDNSTLEKKKKSIYSAFIKSGFSVKEATEAANSLFNIKSSKFQDMKKAREASISLGMITKGLSRQESIESVVKSLEKK